MNAPPFLLGSALIFWGWQTGMWLPAIALAIALESARFVSWRLPIGDKAFTRIADFSTLLLLALAAYQFIFGHFPQGLFVIFQWLPLVLFPLMGAQAYSTGNQIKLGALFLTLRRGQAGQTSIRMDPLYFASCLLGAAAANVQTSWFYGFLSLLLAWMLWGIRPARHSFVLWCAVMLLAIGLGYAGHVGLSLLQSQVQEFTTEWFADFLNSESDPYQSSTHIGKLGRVKLSDRVVLRVKSSEGPPTLLRDAAYNTYVSGTWLARPQQFQPVKPEHDDTSWTLGATSSPSRAVEISLYSKREKAVLALPLGTFRVSNLPAEGLEANAFGGVKVNGIPGLVIYQAQFFPTASWDAPPAPDDLQIPGNLAKPLSTIAIQLRLEARPPKEALAPSEGFFADNFKYTLFLGDTETGPRPLDEFLLRSRAGHCEYFATATVLLLRKAGIPARYATGYSVQEYSPVEGRYLVRARHAHAWALAYIDGHWREIDTTPATWASLEETRESTLQPLFDLGSWLAYQFSLWRMNGIKEIDLRIFIPPGAILAAILAWRLRKKRQFTTRQAREASGVQEPNQHPGADSPFYRIIERLNQGGTCREKRETLMQWINRIMPDEGDKQRL
ncbi:MAG TPA: transglutaminase-like domain-containing protein, partial [Gallionella sp.]|nr:transglutaminase-like domain-containing protein [Gallionella sp.]